MHNRAQRLIVPYLYPSDTSVLAIRFIKGVSLVSHHHNKVERDGHRNATLYRVRPSVCNPIQGQSKHVASCPSSIHDKRIADKDCCCGLQKEETNSDIRYLFIVEKGLVPAFYPPPISQ